MRTIAYKGERGEALILAIFVRMYHVDGPELVHSKKHGSVF